MDPPVVDPIVELATDLVVEEDDKKIRLQLSTILGVNISQARCLAHLKYHLTDDLIDTKIKEIRLLQKTEPNEEHQAKLVELSKNVVRISSETPIAIATLCDNFVKELIKHGMNQAIASDRKNVDIKHLQMGDLTTLVYYPMFKNLSCFVNYSEVEKVKKVEVVKVEMVIKEETTDVESEDEGPTQTSFITYVENAIKSIKKEEMYSTLRINNKVREYLSNMVTELIQRISILSKLLVQKVINVRTMTADHIKSAIMIIMVDNKCTEESITAIIDFINDKIKLYQEHIKSEKTKKESLLDDVTKEENETKLKTKEFEKKKKQADIVLQRAKNNTEKANILKKEVEQLQKTTTSK